MDKVKEQIQQQIECITNEGIQIGNIDYLGKLIDIHKDLANEDYWNVKEESIMNYRENNYGNYGKRGRRYRGEDMIEDMHDGYQEYYENASRYGGESRNTMQSLDCMLRSMHDFIKMLKREASSQDEIDLIQEYSRKISEI